MTTPDAFSLLAAVAAGGAFLCEVRDIHRAPEYRKFIRAIKAILLAYFVVLYLYATLGPSAWWVQAGIGTKSGIIIISFAMAIDVWTLRQSQKRGGNA